MSRPDEKSPCEDPNSRYDDVVQNLSSHEYRSTSDMLVARVLERFLDAGAQRVGLPGPGQVSGGTRTSELARLIDHTALKPQTSVEEVYRLCVEAGEYGFAAVCINPCFVPLAAKLLERSQTAVCTVAGFPLGANRTETKAAEARLAIEDGATEIDMVINIGMLKSGSHEFVEHDIRSVVQAVRSTPGSEDRILVKVILETALLRDDEKVAVCRLAREAGADFVKTSTGFLAGGATTLDVALMHRTVGSTMGVKASGGVRTRVDAEAMTGAGATRIGASASVAIVQGGT